MAESNKKDSAQFLNEKGEFDFAKLLETNPDLLASFIHPRQEDAEGEGGGSEGTQHVSMSFAVGMAALRDALGLSQSYSPLNSADQVRNMSMSAQVNLGLEASQGLSMDIGNGGSFSSAYDANSDEKEIKSYKKVKRSE